MPGVEGPVASFHLVRLPTKAVPRQLAMVVTQRRSLARVPGLDFARVLGTGRGSSTGWGADLRRWALFCNWRSEDDLTAFLDRSAVAARWDKGAVEQWSVRLEPLGGHGSWGGQALGERWMAAAVAAPVGIDLDPGPVAVLTRASVRARHWARFQRAANELSPQLGDQPGLLAHVGVGELPVGRLGTLSFWTSGAELAKFNAGQDFHRDVVRRTRKEGWYAEELFARFRPYASTGTWDGRDPLDRAGNA